MAESCQRTYFSATSYLFLLMSHKSLQLGQAHVTCLIYLQDIPTGLECHRLGDPAVLKGAARPTHLNQVTSRIPTQYKVAPPTVL